MTSEVMMQMATLFGVGVALVSGGIAYGKLDQKTSAAHARLDQLVTSMNENIKRNDDRHSVIEARIATELKQIGDTVKNIEIAIASLNASSAIARLDRHSH
jgi:heme oxygenase